MTKPSDTLAAAREVWKAALKDGTPDAAIIIARAIDAAILSAKAEERERCAKYADRAEVEWRTVGVRAKVDRLRFNAEAAAHIASAIRAGV